MTHVAQIRAARALLGLSVEDLSAASGVDVSVVSTLEAESGSSDDPAHLDLLRRALEARGITFMADGDCTMGGPGVRLTERVQPDDGIRPENLNATNDD